MLTKLAALFLLAGAWLHAVVLALQLWPAPREYRFGGFWAVTFHALLIAGMIAVTVWVCRAYRTATAT